MFSDTQYNRATWYALREFETREITARSYTSRHSRDLNAGKAKEISSNFVQAREYFRNASLADFTVRPLLQYYGVAALSRGLTLFLDPQMRETSLTPGHGLDTCDWQSVLSDDQKEIGRLSVRLKKGTFSELLTATKNKFYFRRKSAGVNWYIGAEVPDPDSEFVFGEIAARVPDISQQYSVWTGKPHPSVGLEAYQVDDENQRYEWVVSIRNADVNAIFPEEKCPNRTITRDDEKIVIRHEQSFLPFFSQKSRYFGIGDVVICSPLDSTKYFTPLAACFMLSYCLGMLCRYFPTTWIGLARSEKGDAVYPLVTRLFDWIQDMFPSMVVDILRGPYDFEK